MQPQIVAIDVESVRSQLSNELSRAVTDTELQLWLRRCGYVQREGKWFADVSRSAARRLSAMSAMAFLRSA